MLRTHFEILLSVTFLYEEDIDFFGLFLDQVERYILIVYHLTFIRSFIL